MNERVSAGDWGARFTTHVVTTPPHLYVKNETRQSGRFEVKPGGTKPSVGAAVPARRPRGGKWTQRTAESLSPVNTERHHFATSPLVAASVFVPGSRRATAENLCAGRNQVPVTCDPVANLLRCGRPRKPRRVLPGRDGPHRPALDVEARRNPTSGTKQLDGATPHLSMPPAVTRGDGPTTSTAVGTPISRPTTLAPRFTAGDRQASTTTRGNHDLGTTNHAVTCRPHRARVATQGPSARRPLPASRSARDNRPFGAPPNRTRRGERRR